MLKNSGRGLDKWWSDLTGRQQIGYGLASAGVALTLALALLSGYSTVSPAWSLSLAIVAVLFQGASAFVFGGVGKADPTHAQASARNLLRLTNNVQRSRKEVERVLEKKDPKATAIQLRDTMTRTSVQLSFAEDAAVDAVEHWRLFHEKAVQKAEALHNNKESTNDKQ
ncbi:hypothetical protein GS448_00170 [Rhodococcus hoagii]|nr:hypothetical protein [Prescottella equi]MBM4665611.1 hypothetical protein [Prescottella equi]NKV87160.1 hypothetical protein [Prescottella equi]